MNILQWLPAEADYKRLDALQGPYTVSADGTISVPFIGEVSTADRTLDQIGGDIAGRLFKEMGMSTRPDVSIGFARRGSVYVLGGVEKPGPVDFAENLTALMAISSAGGYYRDAGGSLRLERDAIAAQAALDLARYKAARSVARLARLESELSGDDTIRIDDKRWPVSVPAAMVEEEKRLMTIRRDSQASRLQSIQNIKDVANKQLVSLSEKAKNLDDQIKLSREELEGIKSLVDRGLATSNRSFSLERIAADLEGRRIDVEQAILQAQLQISQAERDAVDVTTQFRSDTSTDLQTTRGELNENLNSIELAKGLLREARVIAPQQMIDRAGNLKVDIRLMLTRMTNGVSQSYQVGADERLQPGDVLEVEMQPTDDAATVDRDLQSSADAQDGIATADATR